jgi:hypothetical protein
VASGNKMQRISTLLHVTHLENYISVTVMEKLSIMALTPVFKSKYIKDMFQE